MLKNQKFEFNSKKPKIISLVGMMGAGKTKFGRFLSQKLKYHFYDIDVKIQQKFNQSINEIFKNHGEDFFRNEEKKIIKFIIEEIVKERKNSIVSLGGGGFNNQKIQQLLLYNSLVVWLSCPIEILIKRIGKGNDRPMLNDNIKESLEILLKKREKFYKKAHIKLNTVENSFHEMTTKIIQHE